MFAARFWGREILLGSVVIVALHLASCSHEEDAAAQVTEEPVSADTAYAAMVANEEVIAELVTPINRLSRSIQNLHLVWNEELFTERASLVDLDRSALASAHDSPKIRRYDWEIQDHATALRQFEKGGWTSLWEEVYAFEDARLGTLRGEPGEQSGIFITDLKFSARGRTNGGEQAAWKGVIKVWWQKTEEDWKITQLETIKMETMISPQPLFSEVLDRSLTTPKDLGKARNSIHERYIREVFFSGGTKSAH